MRSLPLDAVAVHTPDGLTHARVRGVRILLCGADPPDGAYEDTGEVTCADCRREAELRGDRSIGVVDA